MAKFVCPDCGADGKFIEVWCSTIEYTGTFDDVGDIQVEQEDMSDSYTDRYICLTCEEEFDTPLKVED